MTAAPVAGARVAALPADRRRDRALVATLPVLLAVGCVKWGAYLGRPPVFLTDVLIAGAVAAAAAGRLLAAPHRPADRSGSSTVWSVVALLAYVALRLAFGRELSLVAVRDAAPYAYAALALVSYPAYRRASAAGRRRTVALLEAGLLFHLGWVVVAHFVPAAVAAAPVVNAAQELRVFGLRGGTDATLVGVTGALFLWRYLRARRRWHLAVSLLCVGTVVHITSRAALLATAAALLVVLVSYYSRPVTGSADRSKRLLVTAALPLALLSAAAVLPYTAAGSKLLAGLGLTAATNAADRTGIGTQGARQQAWQLVLGHVDSSHSRLLGVGFGPDFLRDSGATVPLGNGADLRSPHNYLVGSYARLGLIGLVLLLVVLVLALRALLRAALDPDLDELGLLACLVVAALLVSSSFGVELEAPFGAVPFFWSLGIVVARAREHRRDTPA